MKILHVAPSFGIGGLERVVTSLALELRLRSYDVAVAAPYSSANCHALKAGDVPYYEMPAATASVRAQVRAAARLAAVLRSVRPDVVHAHNPAATVATAIAARLACLRIPIVSTYHGVPPESVRRAAAAFNRAATLVVGCGESATASLLEAGLSVPATTVANGVAFENRHRAGRDAVIRRLGLRPTTRLVLNVGRCVEQKNQRTAIAGAARAALENPDLALLVVGDGPLRPDLAAEVSRLGAAQHVVLTGARSDVPDLLDAADAFLSTSLWEGFPLSVLEAMQSSVCVVATDIPPHQDLVTDGSSGLLIGPEAQAVAAALSRVLGDHTLRRRLGETGASMAVRHTIASMTTGYEEIYAGVGTTLRPTASRAALAGAGVRNAA